MQALKDAHSPDDATTIDKITRKMFSIKLGEKESAASLINRVLDLHAALESLGRPFHEIHIVAAIKKSLGCQCWI
jgi:hypothetical protein